jgi:hypothetical protein
VRFWILKKQIKPSRTRVYTFFVFENEIAQGASGAIPLRSMEQRSKPLRDRMRQMIDLLP